MTLRKAFIYTTITFALITLFSYFAQAQTKTITLSQAISLALANNREIKISAMDMEKAQQQILVARSALLPTAGLGVQLNHFFTESPFFGFDNTGSTGDKIPYARFGGRDQASATAWITQPVYNAATKPGIASAQLQERQNRLLKTWKETDIAAAVKQTYIRILVLHERIRLQNESLERNEKALQDARSLLAQGRALRVDTLRAYTSVKNLEPDLLKLSYAIEVGKQQLKTLTGLDSLNSFELSDSLIMPDAGIVLSEDEVYTQAKLHRSDLQTLDLQQQQADQQIQIAGAAMKPTVNLTAQYIVQTQTSQFNYLNAYYPSTPFVGAQLVVPLFNGYTNKGKVKQARIVKDQSQLRSAQAYEVLRTEVKQAVANIREASSRIETSANVSKTAKLSYEITQYRYAKAVASRLELTDAELAYTTAQSNYLEAVYDYLSANIEINRVMGVVGN